VHILEIRLSVSRQSCHLDWSEPSACGLPIFYSIFCSFLTEVSSRPKRSEVEGPAVLSSTIRLIMEAPHSPFVIPTGAKRSEGICSSVIHYPAPNGSASPLLSSRPERSEVEGPAVLSSTIRFLMEAPHSPFVIPTGAKRSEGICSSVIHYPVPNGSASLPLCHPDRSVAKWRDLQFRGPLLEMSSTNA
jgi:hypothetical protein